MERRTEGKTARYLAGVLGLIALTAGTWATADVAPLSVSGNQIRAGGQAAAGSPRGRAAVRTGGVHRPPRDVRIGQPLMAGHQRAES